METDNQILEQEIAKIAAKAAEFGLDGFDMRFELCPPEIIYTFGAYGMPTRFSHWSFGKAYHRLKTQYDYNLSRFYWMVIHYCRTSWWLPTFLLIVIFLSIIVISVKLPGG